MDAKNSSVRVRAFFQTTDAEIEDIQNKVNKVTQKLNSEEKALFFEIINWYSDQDLLNESHDNSEDA